MLTWQESQCPIFYSNCWFSPHSFFFSFCAFMKRLWIYNILKGFKFEVLQKWQYFLKLLLYGSLCPCYLARILKECGLEGQVESVHETLLSTCWKVSRISRQFFCSILLPLELNPTWNPNVLGYCFIHTTPFLLCALPLGRRLSTRAGQLKKFSPGMSLVTLQT